MPSETECACGAGKLYDSCCGCYIEGQQAPPTAEALMRSRYTAYVRMNEAHLLRTWHPATRPHEIKVDARDGMRWTGLEILRTEAGGPADREGVVEFIARYQLAGKEARMHETSRFVKKNGQWVYVDGVASQGATAKQPKTGRNALCPCGSGKKYKKCCLGREA